MNEALTRRIAPIDKEVRPIGQLNVIAKVTFGGELFLRDENDKRSYKGPLFEALPNDLIISKIRVRQGSFCVIGGELDHVAVSPEYPVYPPDCERIDPAYLALVLRTPDFLAQLIASASGNTTKRRPKLMLCDKIFRAVPFRHAPVGMMFLAQVLRISDVRRQIEANVTGTSPTMKNISKPALMNLAFPLPPKPEQITMARALAGARTNSADLREKARKARAGAWKDFEAAVYTAEDDILDLCY